MRVGFRCPSASVVILGDGESAMNELYPFMFKKEYCAKSTLASKQGKNDSWANLRKLCIAVFIIILIHEIHL